MGTPSRWRQAVHNRRVRCGSGCNLCQVLRGRLDHRGLRARLSPTALEHALSRAYSEATAAFSGGRSGAERSTGFTFPTGLRESREWHPLGQLWRLPLALLRGQPSRRPDGRRMRG